MPGRSRVVLIFAVLGWCARVFAGAGSSDGAQPATTPAVPAPPAVPVAPGQPLVRPRPQSAAPVPPSLPTPAVVPQSVAVATNPVMPRASSTVVPYLSAEEEAKTFSLPPGYRLELVVGDPIIENPAVAVFDGNGRMFVAEMRSYMLDVNGARESERISRVSLHWSGKHDGNYDKHTVFIDHLFLPRMLLPLDDGLLVNETGTDEIWLYRDTDGDGVADKRDLFRPGGPRGENLEHQPSGLIWDLDNWLYMAVNPYRLRMKGGQLLSQPTAYNIGQWGLTQDDYGKPWFVQAGLESGPVNFEIPILYGQSEVEGKFTQSFMEVWPLVATADYQGGPVRVRQPEQTLNHFTATCGADVFRGDRLPADLRGDLLFCEPVGRLIRRAKINVKEGFTSLTNPYEAEKSEFIRSTDPNFRPVNLVTAPDGTLYIIDMYHGIIQESAWTAPGSYLRGVILEKQLDKNIGRGRIWRLVHRDFAPGPQPSLLSESPAQWVTRLEHPNGWWRDNAQKLLVLRQDKSVMPALAAMARTSSNHLARIHALWTLEGLDSQDAGLLRQSLADPHPQVRAAAIRVAESVATFGGPSLLPDILDLARDPDPGVVLQALMTAVRLKWPDAQALIASTIATNRALGLQKLGPLVAASAAPPPAATVFTDEEKAFLHRGEDIYNQLCFSCHGLDGRGAPLAGAAAGATMAPSLVGAPLISGQRDAVINIVLKGLNGPIDGKTYTALMVPMQGNDDTWIAAVVSYIRTGFGNSASLVQPGDVARLRATFAERTEPWTVPELLSTIPEPLPDRWRWKVSASHNDKSAALAVDGDRRTRFDTRATQTPGMWFEIKLPTETTVSGLLLDAGPAARDYPRGYEVRLSSDGQVWGQPVATGHGTGALTEIVFPPATAKYIRIIATVEASGRIWGINELQVFKPAPPIPRSILAKKAAPSVFE